MGAALTHAIALAVMGGMVAICMRKGKGAGGELKLPRTFLIHGAWYLFMLLGGALVIGIFWYAGVAHPNVAGDAGWYSLAAAALFGFCLFMFMRMEARLEADGKTLFYRTVFWKRTVDLSLLKAVEVMGLSLTLTFRPAREGEKPQKPLRMLAAFKDMGVLMDAINSHLLAAPAR